MRRVGNAPRQRIPQRRRVCGKCRSIYGVGIPPLRITLQLFQYMSCELRMIRFRGKYESCGDGSMTIDGRGINLSSGGVEGEVD